MLLSTFSPPFFFRTWLDYMAILSEPTDERASRQAGRQAGRQESEISRLASFHLSKQRRPYPAPRLVTVAVSRPPVALSYPRERRDVVRYQTYIGYLRGDASRERTARYQQTWTNPPTHPPPLRIGANAWKFGDEGFPSSPMCF